MSSADAYERFFSAFFPLYKRQCALLRTLLSSEPRHVHDLCCGTGLFTDVLSKTFPAAEIVGADVDPQAIDLAIARGQPRVNFLCTDAVEHLHAVANDSDTLLLIRGAFHFLEKRLDLRRLIDGLGPRSTLVVGERSDYSAQAYPVPPASKSRLLALTSPARQAQFLTASASAAQVECFGQGGIVLCPTVALVGAVRARAMSYLDDESDDEIERWAAALQERTPVSVPILEDYRYYIYRGSN